MLSTFIVFYAHVSVVWPQGNFKARWGGGVQPRRRAAGTVSSETTAEHVGDDASIHTLQGGSGQHGQRGKSTPLQKRKCLTKSRKAWKSMMLMSLLKMEISWWSLRKTARDGEKTVNTVIKSFNCSALTLCCFSNHEIPVSTSQHGISASTCNIIALHWRAKLCQSPTIRQALSMSQLASMIVGWLAVFSSE